MLSMYVRVKRHMTTWFIQCEPSEKASDIKRRLRELTEQPEADQKLILVSSGEQLDDSRTLAEQKVENDCIVGLVHRLEDGSGWEDLHIERPEDHMGGMESENM